MRNADKDRNPEKARKRAKNDARTAVRKLSEWAEELDDSQSLRSLKEVDSLLSAVSERLTRKASA